MLCIRLVVRDASVRDALNRFLTGEGHQVAEDHTPADLIIARDGDEPTESLLLASNGAPIILLGHAATQLPSEAVHVIAAPWDLEQLAALISRIAHPPSA